MEKENNNFTKESTIFIIGSGPSLRDVDVSRLNGLNTFSMNRQYISYGEWGFFPTYYACIDKRLRRYIAEDIANLVDEAPIKKFFFTTWGTGFVIPNLWKAEGAQAGVVLVPHNSYAYEDEEVENLKTYVPPKWIPGMGISPPSAKENDVYRRFVLNNTKPISHDESVGSNIDRMTATPESAVFHKHSWGNCGIFSSNVACLMGYQNIVLLGMDANYSPKAILSGSDNQHYHPKYFDPKNFKMAESNSDLGLEVTHGPPDEAGTLAWRWREFKEWAWSKYPRSNIISATKNSSINNFLKYKNYDHLIDLIKR